MGISARLRLCAIAVREHYPFTQGVLLARTIGEIKAVDDISFVIDDKVRHPYTKALPSARVDRREDEIVLTGEIPSPLDPPRGRRFHTRCPFAMRRCTQEEPVLREVAPDHLVACHLEG